MQRLIPLKSPCTNHTPATLAATPCGSNWVPLWDTAGTRLIETHAQAQTSADQPSLMQRAGYALFRLINACYPHAQHICVLAGAGNNGGDAIQAAVWLHRQGKTVQVIWLGNVECMSTDTAQAVKAAQNAELTLQTHAPCEIPAHVDLIVDGLLGIGLQADRPLSADMQAWIKTINAHPAAVIAVDVPSGLLADTGAILDDCVQANTTLTLLCAKPGLFTGYGRQCCGDTWLDTLDITPDLTPAQALLYTPCNVEPAPRAHNTHKGSFGDVAIVGGAPGMLGAAILAARAAITAGAGRVYACLQAEKTPSPATSIKLDILHPEVMFRPLADLALADLTIACGCGGGNQVAHVLPALLAQCPRLVLDADALNAIAQSANLQQTLANRHATGFASIMTPHPLEAARLLGTSTAQVQANRINAAQTLAQRFQCVCVLKGSGSITAAPQKPPIINSSGNAALATAGSGDVLSGWLTGRWSACAQTSAISGESLHTLAAHSVWEHGNAADRWLQAGYSGAMPASKLIT